MLGSYFFIPGDKSRYLNKLNQLEADFYVIDLEDAVSKNNKQTGFENVLQLNIDKNTFIRIPFFDNCYSENQLIELINHFEGRIVVPKLNNRLDLDKILSLKTKGFLFKIIILVENPLCFVHLKEILSYHDKNIYGIGFGSHDFCTLMGMKHELRNLIHYKKELILLAKAYKKVYIDTVDLNLKDFTVFREECLFAFENGADGKFLIHPLQLNQIKSIEYLSTQEKQKLKKLYEKIINLNLMELDVIEIEGEIFEMPHIKRIIDLYEKINR
jgi:citrate lyase subunit beta / citryl-CoA lyase